MQPKPYKPTTMKTITLFFAIFAMATMISCTGGGVRNQNVQQTEHTCCDSGTCSAREDGSACCGGGACATKQSERQRPDWLSGVSPDMHTSEMSLDFFGTYEGVLPSASGMGIVTIVTLNEDRTFEMSKTYLRGDSGEELLYEGNYTIEFGEIVVLDLGNGNEMFFDLREGSLALLDNQMNRIENEPFQPRYLLMMIDSGIAWHD